MKNVIEIDMLNNCRCDLISNVNDGTDALFLNIKCDVSLNPKLNIQGVKIPITGNPFLYQVSDGLLVGTGNITFNLVDDKHVGETFTIQRATSGGGNLYLKRISDFIYKLQNIQTSGSGSGNVDLSDYYTKSEVDEKLKEISTTDLSNYYTKTEVDNLLKSKKVSYLKFNYYKSGIVMNNTTLLGNIILPQGAYFLIVTVEVSGANLLEEANVSIYWHIGEHGVPREGFNVYPTVNGNNTIVTADAVELYATDGTDTMNVAVIPSGEESQFNGYIDVRINAVRIGDEFVLEN